jgi:hypothetical protein
MGEGQIKVVKRMGKQPEWGTHCKACSTDTTPQSHRDVGDLGIDGAQKWSHSYW